MLGLRHAGDYTGDLKNQTSGSVMKQCSSKGRSFEAEECEIIEKNLTGFLKPLGN